MSGRDKREPDRRPRGERKIVKSNPTFRFAGRVMYELTRYIPVGRILLTKSAISFEPLIYRLFSSTPPAETEKGR